MIDVGLRKKVIVLIRCGLGLVFLASGFLKILNPNLAAAFLDSLLPMDPLILRTTTVMLAVAEGAAGILIILNRYLTIVVVIVGGILLASTLAATFLLATPIACGCFGDLYESKTDELLLIRNYFLLACAMILLWDSSRKEDSQAP